MGILDFIRRRKKDEDTEEPSFEENPTFPESNETSNTEILGPRSRFNPEQTFPLARDINPFNNNTQSMSNSDIQLLITKLDLINQRLEVLDRRIQVIEEIAKENR